MTMDRYYVNNNQQRNGDHEVHKHGCGWMPANVTYLGSFSSCVPAVQAAKRIYPQSNGCYFCSNACNTQ